MQSICNVFVYLIFSNACKRYNVFLSLLVFFFILHCNSLLKWKHVKDWRCFLYWYLISLFVCSTVYSHSWASTFTAESQSISTFYFIVDSIEKLLTFSFVESNLHLIAITVSSLSSCTPWFGQFIPFSWQILPSSSRLDGGHLWTAIYRFLQRCSMEFKSKRWLGPLHSDTFAAFIFPLILTILPVPAAEKYLYSMISSTCFWQK